MGSDSSSSPGSVEFQSPTHIATSAQSSPPVAEDIDHDKMAATSQFATEHMLTEEKKARDENTRAEAKRLAQARKRRKKPELSPQERAAKAKELDELLRKSSIFSEILTQKTKALGRVGRDFGNETLADVGVELKKQPKIMTGGTMRDYQLEGLTWMYEIMLQGMSGILADEMGLGRSSGNRSPNTELILARQDDTNHLTYSVTTGTRILLRPSFGDRATQYTFKLARRIPKMGTVYSLCSVSWKAGGTSSPFQERDLQAL